MSRQTLREKNDPVALRKAALTSLLARSRSNLPDPMWPPRSGQRLALWTSLISARALSSFYEQNYSSCQPGDLQMMSFENLEYISLDRLGDFELSYIAIYVKDTISDKDLQALLRMTQHQKTPLTICHCGTANTESEKKWRAVIHQLTQHCKIRINYFENDLCRGEFHLQPDH